MFQPHSNNWLNSKFEIYDILRNLDKAYYSDKYNLYVITRYEDVVFALNNPDIFSSAKGNLIVENPHRFNRTLGASDNPIHSYFKNIVKEAYSKENLQRVKNSLEYVIDQEFVARPLDLAKAIKRISAYVVAEIINLPYNKHIVQDIIIDIQDTALHALQDSTSREAHDRFTNLVKFLLNTTPAEGPGIYAEYLKAGSPGIMSLFTGPTISGMSSLVGALQFLVLDLYRSNMVNHILNNRSLIPLAIAESLRYNASTGRFSRTVMEYTNLHGVELKPDDRVAICLESANRDPRIFDKPEKFDIYRDTSKSLGFGRGVHACIALVLSRMCMEVFLNRLLDTYGEYSVEPMEQLNFVITASGNDDMLKELRLI